MCDACSCSTCGQRLAPGVKVHAFCRSRSPRMVTLRASPPSDPILLRIEALERGLSAVAERVEELDDSAAAEDLGPFGKRIANVEADTADVRREIGELSRFQALIRELVAELLPLAERLRSIGVLP